MCGEGRVTLSARAGSSGRRVGMAQCTGHGDHLRGGESVRVLPRLRSSRWTWLRLYRRHPGVANLGPQEVSGPG